MKTDNKNRILKSSAVGTYKYLANMYIAIYDMSEIKLINQGHVISGASHYLHCGLHVLADDSLLAGVWLWGPKWVALLQKSGYSTT